MNLENINWQIVAPLIAIQLILMIVGLIDLSKREATKGPKILWVIILVFGSLLGSIAYFTIGRRNDA
ncbi:MAG: PLD nuclease N-terminal domain-containing protein [Candidatus Cohnella colombiensis]|uniref:PLD nuclease N-terminal domain-containing protein n=1 Tax=Candidatus Cohnella colombiensis TaxID=3121368 RepID=A0AA95JFZ3_9BACL|nr:MAG: PLD nuclease N-terminal domain-containing protein [Cohnella sp.]